jgi:hypothetical protein
MRAGGCPHSAAIQPAPTSDHVWNGAPNLPARAVHLTDVGGTHHCIPTSTTSLAGCPSSPCMLRGHEQFGPRCALLRRFPLDGPTPNEVTENYSYLPFGGGRRKCIGDQFALFEAIVALSMLLRRYDFSPSPEHPEVGMTTGEP